MYFTEALRDHSNDAIYRNHARDFALQTKISNKSNIDYMKLITRWISAFTAQRSLTRTLESRYNLHTHMPMMKLELHQDRMVQMKWEDIIGYFCAKFRRRVRQENFLSKPQQTLCTQTVNFWVAYQYEPPAFSLLVSSFDTPSDVDSYSHHSRIVNLDSKSIFIAYHHNCIV